MQPWIFRTGGPRTGEHVVVDAGLDGDGPSEITLLNLPHSPPPSRQALRSLYR
jgi:hypothetical protein